jgi:hypothetical protein
MAMTGDLQLFAAELDLALDGHPVARHWRETRWPTRPEDITATLDPFAERAGRRTFNRV